MAIFIAVGLIASFLYAKQSVQRRATLVAFASLALIVLVFVVAVIGFSQMQLLPYLAISCAVVPAVLYGCAVLIFSPRGPQPSKKRKSVAAQKARSHDQKAAFTIPFGTPGANFSKAEGEADSRPKPAPTRQVATPVRQPVAAQQAVTTQKPVSAWQAEVVRQPAVAQRVATTQQPAAAQAASTTQQPVALHDQTTQSFPVVNRVTPAQQSPVAVVEQPSAAIAAPAPEPVPTPAPVSTPEPKSAPAPIPKPELAPEPEPAPIPKPEPTPEPIPEPELVPEPEPIPEPIPDPEPEPAPIPAASSGNAQLTSLDDLLRLAGSSIPEPEPEPEPEPVQPSPDTLSLDALLRML
ncbi:MAG: hypothetical protein RSD25_02870 [Raoultibacter sp.]